MSGCDKKQNTDIIQEFSNAEKDHAISIDIKKEERDEIQKDDTIQPQNNDVNDENSIIENRLDNYKKWFILSHPESASEDEIEKGVITTYYYDLEGEVAIDVIDYDDKKCTAKYNVTTQKGNQYQYDLIMEKIYQNTNVSLNQDNYYATEIYLNPDMVDYKTFSDSFYYRDFTESNDDVDNLIEFFENYENTVFSRGSRRPFKKPYEVIDYVKLDITGTGYNDYLVVFGENNVLNNKHEFSSNISHLSCFRMEEANSNFTRHLVYMLPESAANFPSSIYQSDKLKEVAYFFDGGTVLDFNQNGINEIYIAYSRVTGMSSNDNVMMVEWDGNDFVPSIVHSGDTKNHFSRIRLSFNFDNMSLNISEEFFVPTKDVVIGMPNGIGISAYSYYTYKWHDDEDMYLMTQKILMK